VESQRETCERGTPGAKFEKTSLLGLECCETAVLDKRGDPIQAPRQTKEENSATSRTRMLQKSGGERYSMPGWEKHTEGKPPIKRRTGDDRPVLQKKKKKEGDRPPYTLEVLKRGPRLTAKQFAGGKKFLKRGKKRGFQHLKERDKEAGENESE